MLRNRVFISEGNSYSLAFPSSASDGAGQVGRELQSLHSCTNYRLFSSPFSPSVCLPLHHLYSRRPNGERREETLRRPCGACFLPADTEEAITARRGQIGWGSYLGRIMFDILHHYQLPLLLLRSHISPSLMCH